MNPLALGAAMLALCICAPAIAQEQYRSVLFQNDLFLGHDGGGYTNGVFLTSIQAASSDEEEVPASPVLQSIAPMLGLPRATLTAWSIGQIMVTPRDITRSDPAADDAPYAGALVLRAAQVYVQDDVAEILAFNAGVIGPASGAAQTQRFFHRAVGTDTPQGWHTQVANKPLLGLERYRAWRFPLQDTQERGGASGDFIALGGGGLSNLESSVGLGLLLRYGVGLEKSFPAAARLSVRSADPILIGRGWFGFASLSVDRLFNYVGVGPHAFDDGDASLRKLRILGAVGFAHGWRNASLGFSLQAGNPVVKASNRAQTYGSVTFTYRMN